MKKNPRTTFIQLLRTKTNKNKIKNKYSEKNTKKNKKKRNLTLMQLQVKRGREKKQIRKVY